MLFSFRRSGQRALPLICLLGLHATGISDDLLPPIIHEAASADQTASKPFIPESRHLFPSGPVATPLILQTSGVLDETTPQPQTKPIPYPDPATGPGVQPIVVPAPAPVPQSKSTSEIAPVPTPNPVPHVTAEHGYPDYFPAPPVQQYQYRPTAARLPEHWFSGEALLWWTNGVHSPVIATTSPQGTPGLQAGVLGQPNTSVLYSGQNLYNFPQAGFRLQGGRWFSCDGSGYLGEFLMLAPRKETFHASTFGDPIVARPFTNPITGQEDSQLLSYPGLSFGTLDFEARTSMYSAALALWAEIERCDDCSCQSCGEGCSCDAHHQCGDRDRVLGVSFGPRIAHLEDDVRIRETLVSAGSGSQFFLSDVFKTENSFLGAELGLRGERSLGQLDLNVGLRLALGLNHQELDTYGYNTVTSNGVTTASPGGFYVQQSNTGGRSRNKISLIPALDAGVGWRLSDCWKLNVSYSLMYWTNVVRAAQQMDSTINTDFFAPPIDPSAGPNRPAGRFRDSDYLAQGISFGLERRW
ncbi:MAG: BBP7 family outer membrane beta-barrel protein [Planctomycetaceae bacterium]